MLSPSWTQAMENCHCVKYRNHQYSLLAHDMSKEHVCTFYFFMVTQGESQRYSFRTVIYCYTRSVLKNLRLLQQITSILIDANFSFFLFLFFRGYYVSKYQSPAI